MRIHLCGVRGSTPAPGPEFVRYGGHTSCVALAHDGAAGPALILDAGTGLRRVTGLLGGARLRGHHPAHPPALGSRPWAALLPGGRPRRRPGHAAAARSRPGGTGGGRAGPGHVPAALPDHARRVCGELDVRHARARAAQGRRLHGGGAGGAAQGRPDVRLPGQRRAVGDHLHPRSLPHRARGPGPRDGASTTPLPSTSPPGRTLLIHDAFLLPRGGRRRGVRSGIAAADYAVGLGERAGARRVMLAHHKPDRTDAELDLAGRAARGRAGRAGPRAA